METVSLGMAKAPVAWPDLLVFRTNLREYEEFHPLMDTVTGLFLSPAYFLLFLTLSETDTLQLTPASDRELQTLRESAVGMYFRDMTAPWYADR